jgi:hypothetical protein
MKVKGRWASDAFLIYLTKHAQILAPYMQAHPVLHSVVHQNYNAPNTAPSPIIHHNPMVSHSSPGICEAYQQSELSW